VAIDEAAFLKNERPGEYRARFYVRGEISITFKADSLEAAKAIAESKIKDEKFGLKLDDASEVELAHVQKTRPMFLVNRGGGAMQVTRLIEGDEPRQPDEHGF
jgi:hypothetical protein